MRRTRREVLAAGTSLLAHTALASPFRHARITPATTDTIFIGTDTNKGGQGIYRARFDSATGQITNVELAAPTVQPSFLALGNAAGRRVLYSVNEMPDASAGVTSFDLDRQSGSLHQTGKVPTGIPGPCYVSVDATGRAVFTADYSGGGVSTFRVEPNGTLAGPVEQINFHDPRFGTDGPQADRQSGPHPHSVTISPDNRFVVVNALGHDTIVIFALDPDGARLSDPTVFHTEPGSGPRHVAFHPNQRWLYGVNELASTVVHYLWNETHGAKPQALLVRAHGPVKTTAASFHGENTAAEIAISPNGAFLYVSNRGEDSLAVFAINQNDGSVRLIQTISCGGKTPRQFTLDPTGRWILCGNQGSANITIFHRDPGSGHLTGPVHTTPVPSPYFILFTT